MGPHFNIIFFLNIMSPDTALSGIWELRHQHKNFAEKQMSHDDWLYKACNYVDLCG